jgi:hypothetical protein
MRFISICLSWANIIGFIVIMALSWVHEPKTEAVDKPSRPVFYEVYLDDLGVLVLYLDGTGEVKPLPGGN